MDKAKNYPVAEKLKLIRSEFKRIDLNNDDIISKEELFQFLDKSVAH